MSKGKIVVADDDSAIVDVLQLILEDEGYEVLPALNGDAIYKLASDNPDLFLLDIWMSGVDGRDLCKYLKTTEETKHVPVILVSANKDTEKIARAAGADDFLDKPFDMQTLLDKVAFHLKK